MATKRRDPTAIESAQTIARRRRAIQAALSAGALRGYLADMLRREILVERAVRSYQTEAAVLFAKHIEAPLLIAIASSLGTRPEPPPPAAAVGKELFVPAPVATPAGLPSTIARVFADGGKVVFGSIEANLVELAAQEVATTSRSMVKNFGVDALAGELAAVPPKRGPDAPTGPLLPPAADQVAQRVVQQAKSTPMFGSVVEKAWGKSLGDLRERVETKVGEALQRGATNDEIVRMLRGTKAQKYQDGILPGWRSYHVQAFVRTAATHMSAQSREGSFAALGVPFVQLVATLDLRTTPTCIRLDKTIWPVGSGPRPPLHPNCRTNVVPSWSEKGDDSAEFGGKRASKDGPVPSTLDAREWWKSLPEAEQNANVGRTRAEALRSGKLDWEQLFGPGLEPLTNRQLRAVGLLPSE